MNAFNFNFGKDGDGQAPEWTEARRALAQLAPPDRVEDALLKAFALRHPKRPWYRRWSIDACVPWASLGALGCALAIAVAGLLPGGPMPTHAEHVLAVADDGFLTLVSPDRIAAAVNPQLKEADLPRAALVQMGIPINADAPQEMIHAELLVADTGEPLAIRLAVN
jgi:hypothetical protein